MKKAKYRRMKELYNRPAMCEGKRLATGKKVGGNRRSGRTGGGVLEGCSRSVVSVSASCGRLALLIISAGALSRQQDDGPSRHAEASMLIAHRHP